MKSKNKVIILFFFVCFLGVWKARGWLGTGAADPPLPLPYVQLIAKRDGCGRPPRTEELFRKFFHNRRVVALAAENIEIGVVGVVCKVAADQRGRDQLEPRITRH